jgi:hypothetical protein
MIGNDNNERMWGKTVEAFRTACLLRRNGKLDEANRMLEWDVPGAIAAWSQASILSAGEKRSQLERMFREEQRRIDDAWLVQKLVADRFEETIGPRLVDTLAEEVRETVIEAIESAGIGQRGASHRTASPAPLRGRFTRPAPRIRFDDIPGVIDSILQEQSLDRGLSPALNAA